MVVVGAEVGLLKNSHERFGQFEIVSDTVVTPTILGKVEIAKMP